MWFKKEKEKVFDKYFVDIPTGERLKLIPNSESFNNIGLGQSQARFIRINGSEITLTMALMRQLLPSELT